ncbi:MAG: hypothetical protein KKA79_00575 [Nanoarchaeota archaeon]|nr:hypothetical protein [Nanoarchaeota archaeon]MCG2717667.1 hypothetical protein [Nanoarchaeota archaeon]
MKVPNSFRPEKDLEDKTEQLVEEAKIVNYNKRCVDPDELEDMISHFDHMFLNWSDPSIFGYSYLHDTIDEFVEKTNYQKSDLSNDKFTYWTRPDPVNASERYVFIRRLDNDSRRRYSFARVNKNDFTKFGKSFELYFKSKNILFDNYRINGQIYKSFLASGAAVGGLSLYILQNVLAGLPFYTISQTAAMAGLFGLTMGPCLIAFTGIPLAFGALKLAKYWNKKFEAKIKLNYEDMTLEDDRTAILKAFS